MQDSEIGIRGKLENRSREGRFFWPSGSSLNTEVGNRAWLLKWHPLLPPPRPVSHTPTKIKKTPQKCIARFCPSASSPPRSPPSPPPRTSTGGTFEIQTRIQIPVTATVWETGWRTSGAAAPGRSCWTRRRATRAPCTRSTWPTRSPTSPPSPRAPPRWRWSGNVNFALGFVGNGSKIVINWLVSMGESVIIL